MSMGTRNKPLFTSPVNPERVRPVCFYRYGCEALFFNQTFGDVGAVTVELVCSMRAVPDQDDLGLACRGG